VSVPVPQSNQQIRADIKQRIASGEFNLGTPVLDNEYTKVVLTSEGFLTEKIKFVKIQQESTLSKTSVLKVSSEIMQR